MEILVSTYNDNIPTRVEPLGNAKFQVSFVPVVEGTHLVYVTFNEESVPGNYSSAIFITNHFNTRLETSSIQYTYTVGKMHSVASS